MQIEVLSASNFLVHLVCLGRLQGQSGLSESQLEEFRSALVAVLRKRYRDHWFPEQPHKGSGYRCIRINGILDPVIAQAGESSGLSSQMIRKTFPAELTLWIDPKEVCYRFGENGSICVLYDSTHQGAWKPTVKNNATVAVPSRKKLQSKNLEEQVRLLYFYCCQIQRIESGSTLGTFPKYSV